MTDVDSPLWTEDEMRRASLYGLCGVCHRPLDVARTVWSDVATRQTKGRVVMDCPEEHEPGWLLASHRG